MRGFTLIETIIYLSIFALISGSVVFYVLLMSEVNQKRQVMAEVLYAGERINSYLQMEINNADSISSPLFQNEDSSLIIEKNGDEINVACIDDKVLVTNNTESFILHPSTVKCRNLVFNNISALSPAIKYSVELYKEGQSREFDYSLDLGTSLIKL